MRLAPFLIFLSGVSDVRHTQDWYNKFRTSQYIEFTDITTGTMRLLDKDRFLQDAIQVLNEKIYKKKLEKKLQKPKNRNSNSVYSESLDLLEATTIDTEVDEERERAKSYELAVKNDPSWE